MSDVSVRGSVTYATKLWEAFARHPRSLNRAGRAGRPLRASGFCSASTATDHAGTQRNGRAAVQHLAESAPPPSCGADLGYSRELNCHFDLGEQIGSGGNAVVHVVHDKLTGKAYACKSIAKILEGPGVSESKSAGHIASIRREIQVLKKLRGSLNVACLERVYEDDYNVHLILDYCKGGELVHAIGSRHYSERTVRVCAPHPRQAIRDIAGVPASLLEVGICRWPAI